MAGPIRIAILANAAQARKEFNSTANDAQGMGSKIGGAAKKVGLVAGAGLAVAGAAALKLGAASVKSASDAQQSLGATQTVFGKYAGTVITQSNRAAKSVGLSANEYRELANVMGASLSGAGIPLKKTASLTEDINKRAADMAATFGGTTKNAVEAIGSLMRGEADPIEAYGVSIKQSDVSARLAAKGLDGLTGSALKQAEMQARLDLLMQKTAKTQGAFKRESNTLAHQQQVLSAQFENVKAKIGTALLPVLTTLLTMLNANIGPAFQRVTAFVAPLVAKVQEFFAGLGGGPSVLAPFVAVLQTAAATVTGVVIPAVISLASYVATALLPVFSQIAAVVTGKVLPILTSLAQFVYGTLVPAVVAVAKRVASNLKPVFDQLVATISGKVIPAVAKILDKFREWQPTIQRVIVVVVKVVGAVLELASAILGKVLPPAIRFAGFLTGVLVGAVTGAIGVIVKIIAKVIDFGGAVIDGARKVGEFAGKVKDKIAEVVGFFTGLPAKIRAALSGAGTMLTDIGRRIVEGLGNGIESAKQWVIDKIKALADLVPGWVKKRLGIASPSKVTARLGMWAARGLGDGLKRGGVFVVNAAKGLAQKAIDAIQTKIDSATALRDSVTSLRDQLAGALSPDLFGGRDDDEGTALSKFRAGLEKAKATAEAVREAIRKLTGAGVSGSFLQSLVGSGNTDLVVQLAGAGDAAALAKEYEAMLAVNAESGLAVAENVIGVRLDDVNANLYELGRQMEIERQNLKDELAAQRAAEKAERQADRAQDKDERKKDREQPRRIELRLSAQEVDQLSRGKNYSSDIDAYERAGGRRRA